MASNRLGLLTVFVLIYMSSPVASFFKVHEPVQPINRSEIQSMIHFRDYYGTLAEFVDRPGYSLAKIGLKKDQKIFGSRSGVKELVVYIHGFRESPDSKSVRTVLGAYLKRDHRRYVLVDWSRLVNGTFKDAVGLVNETASTVANYLGVMHSSGYTNIHLIGHSLGAHVAGLVQKYTNFTIDRVTALDPANLGMFHSGGIPLSRKSAKFVDVVHTDGGIYGLLTPVGTVDFYANGGKRPQPGCFLFWWPLSNKDLCSHWASWRYYARTIAKPQAFPALKCDSYIDVMLGKCKKTDDVFFSEKSSDIKPGIYVFSTRRNGTVRASFTKHL